MSSSEGELEIAEIIGERKTSKRGLEYLVKWKGFGDSHNTWEPLKNLKNAAKAVADFHSRTMSGKKTRKSSSKSRSRSRSRSRGRSTPGSKSKGNKSTSRSRSRGREAKTTKTKTTTVSTPTSAQTRTETVTKSPGRKETTTETITRSVLTPSLIQRSTRASRKTEVRTTTDSVDGPKVATARGWVQTCCAPFHKVQDYCRGLVRSDYPAIVVFATIAIVTLCFVLERNVDFSKLWETISGFFMAIWVWLKNLFPGK